MVDVLIVALTDINRLGEKISPKNEIINEKVKKQYLAFSLSTSNIFSCTESNLYLSLTSAHFTRNDRDSLPTYAPPPLPKWRSNSEADQKIGRYRK